MFDLSHNAFVFGQNISWAFSELVALTIVAFIYRRRVTQDFNDGVLAVYDFKMVTLGLMLGFAGVILHRVWWAWWRIVLDAAPHLDALFRNSLWPSVFVAMTIIGSAMMTSPLSRSVFGKSWFVLVCGTVFSVWIGSAYLAQWTFIN